MSDGDLAELEQRVSRKWLAAAEARLPDAVFDFTRWLDPLVGIEPPPAHTGRDWDFSAITPQFPREQWASYPAARAATLITCEALLDGDDELTDEQWLWLCMAMQYGGKTRLG